MIKVEKKIAIILWVTLMLSFNSALVYFSISLHNYKLCSISFIAVLWSSVFYFIKNNKIEMPLVKQCSECHIFVSLVNGYVAEHHCEGKKKEDN